MADGEIRIEYIPLGDLARWPGNPRKHNLELLEASHRRFGFVPGRLLVDETTGRLVAGHGNIKRLEAARLAGQSPPARVRVDDSGAWLVPVIRGVAFKNEAEAEAFLLADNRTAEESGWHTDPLAKMLGRGIDLSGIGWGKRDVAKILAAATPPAEEDGPVGEPPTDPITKPGELYQLGRHRLLCGDATKAEDVASLLDETPIDLVLTDPPYGVGVDYSDFRDTEENVRVLVARVFPILRGLKCPMLITAGVPGVWIWPKPDWLLAWVHPAPSGSGPWGFMGLNPVLAYGRDPYLRAARGRRPDALVLAADREGMEGHPTPKPVRVWSWLLERGSVDRGQTIYDPFVGSGTTVIAAEQLGRTCLAMELDPGYCDVVVQRWERLTGEKARRA